MLDRETRFSFVKPCSGRFASQGQLFLNSLCWNLRTRNSGSRNGFDVSDRGAITPAPSRLVRRTRRERFWNIRAVFAYNPTFVLQGANSNVVSAQDGSIVDTSSIHRSVRPAPFKKWKRGLLPRNHLTPVSGHLLVGKS